MDGALQSITDVLGRGIVVESAGVAVMDDDQFSIRALGNKMIRKALQARGEVHAQFIHAREVGELLDWTWHIGNDTVGRSLVGKSFRSPNVLKQCAPFFLYIFFGVQGDCAVHDQFSGLSLAAGKKNKEED